MKDLHLEGRNVFYEEEQSVTHVKRIRLNHWFPVCEVWNLHV